MRLINADEFAIEEPKLWDWSSIDGISSTAVLKQCIWDVQCAPTVEAIPIEFIKEEMESSRYIWSNSSVKTELYWRGVYQGLMVLIRNWEKENEKNEID